MVDLFQLLDDTTSLLVFLLLPPAIIAVMFLLGWERELKGEFFGFGKRTFLLLAVGGVVGWIANLPVLALNSSVLMVNVGGALFPIAVSLVVLERRILPGRTRELFLFLGALALTIAICLPVLIRFPPSTNFDLRVDTLGFLLAATAGLVFHLALRRSVAPQGAKSRALDAPVAFVLLALGMWGTFLTTQVVFQVGIESNFPAYLVAPTVIAVGSVALRWPRRDSPALAFAASTLGVLTGADILHQPELFRAPAFLGAIGGAGPLDLVYLSGPFSLAIALLLDRLLRRISAPVAEGGAVSETPSAQTFGPLRGPEGRFQPGLQAFAEGRYHEVVPQVLRTLDQDLAETRTALGLPSTPESPTGRGLEPVPVHPFLAADLANLRQLSKAPGVDREDARRALVTGFLVQRGLLDLLGRRLASFEARLRSYAIDLTIAVLPSVALLYLILRLLGTDAIGALASVYYLAAMSAVGAWPYLVYALLEWRYGWTPGKRVADLQVVGLDGRRPTLLAALARNSPKLIPLAGISYALGLGVAFAYYATSLQEAAFLAGVSVLAGVLVIALAGLVSFWAMRATPRHQRLGDLMGATMVWKRLPPVSPGTPMAPGASLSLAPAPVSPPPPPLGLTGPLPPGSWGAPPLPPA